MTTLTEALAAVGIKLPSGWTVDRTYRMACPRCNKDKRDDALSVTVKAADDVVWSCFRKCGFKGGWPPRGADRADEPAKAAHVQDHPAKRKRASGLSDYGHRIWEQSGEITADCPAARWLANRRCAAALNDVRWHPSIWHTDARRAFPCMVALVTDIATCAPLSLHLTYVTEDGQKAAGDDSRRYLHGCTTTGGVIRLSPDDDVTTGLVIGEGLETCATALHGTGPVWSCMDAGHIERFPVLPGIECLTVLVDADKAGRNAFAKVRDRWRRAGREVIGLEAPIGNDLNDWMRAA